MARVRRWLGIAGKVLVGIVVTLAALAALVVVSVNVPVVRRFVADEVTAALAGVVSGKIVVDHVGSIEPTSVDGVRVHVETAKGRKVLSASGVSAHIDTLALVKSLFGGPGLVVHLDSVDMGHLDALLDTNDDGQLLLVKALTPPPPPGAPPPSPSKLELVIDDAHLDSGWVHGRPASGFPIDADLNDMHLGVRLVHGTTALALRSLHVDTRGMPDGANVHGSLTAQATLPPAPEKLLANAGFDGTIGGVRTHLDASMKGDAVAAHLVADGAPGAIAELVPALQPEHPTHLKLDAEGTLPKLHATATVTSGLARLTLSADVTLGTPLHAHVELGAKHVDLATLLPSGPKTDIGGQLSATGTLPGRGKPTATFELHTEPSEIASRAIPKIAVQGKLAENRVNATLGTSEPGIDARVETALNLSRLEVPFDVNVSTPDIARWKRAPRGVSGRASIHARGTVFLGTKTVNASFRAEAAHASGGGLRIGTANVQGSVSGPFVHPRFQATAAGTELAAAGRTFRRFTVSADGTPRQAGVAALLRGAKGTPDVDAATTVELGKQIVLKRVQVKIGKPGQSIRARVAYLSTGGGAVRADGVVVEGAGAALAADARIARHAMTIRARSPGFDVGKAARALALGDRVSGEIALDVNLRTRGRTAHGNVDVELASGRYAGITGIALRATTSMDGRSFTGRVRAKLDDSHLDVDAENLTLGGSPVSPRAWERAYGHVRVDSDLNLGRMAKVLPAWVMPLDDMAGHVALRGELTRGKDDASPETSWTLHTSGFRASAKSGAERSHDSVRVRARPPWRAAGVDVDAFLSIAKERGRTTMDARFHDELGALAEFDATADVPYETLLDNPAGAARLIETMPLTVRLAVPRRKLSKLPAMLQTSGFDGDVELSLEAGNTIREPTVRFEGDLLGLEPRGRIGQTAVNVHMRGRYDNGEGHLGLNVACKKQDALVVHSDVQAKISRFLDRQEGDPPPWNGSLSGRFDDFPLAALSLFGSRRLEGAVSGTFSAGTGTDTSPHAKADVAIDRLRIGRPMGPTSRASLNAAVNDRRATAKVSLDQPDGFIHASASAGLRWTGPLSPSLDLDRGATKADATAKNFRLTALQPFVRGVVADIDGRVDADVHVAGGSAGAPPKLGGSAVLDGGAFELTSTGQELRNVHAKVVLSPDGKLTLNDVHARGLTGSLDAHGTATLRGLSLTQAKLSAKIPSSDPFPIAVQGQPFAKASGEFDLEAKPAPAKNEIDLDVTVHKGNVQLPTKSAHDLQTLEPVPHVRVGYYRTPDEFIVVPLERPPKFGNTGPPTKLVARVKLDNVVVVRGTDMRAELDGLPTVHTGEQTQVFGDIHLRSGFLYVQGKKFQIEKGTISFIGPPDNPNVVVTAGWTAPEGTQVYADFIGPLKTGKVTLRSEPPHTKNEILSLILFGTTNGMSAGSGGSPTLAAAGVAGGIATQGLNKALDDLTGLEITTRIDTSDSANPRPELEVRVARDVTVSVSHVLGVPPPGTNPDLNYATVDWRFLRNWSLDTTIGDLGSSIVDLIWQYRY